MISSLLFDKTPAEVRLDAPIDATIHIPLNMPRALFRLLSLLFMAGGSLFALVTVAMHFNDPTFLTKMGPASGALGDSVTVVRILQLLIAAGTLLFAVFAMLRLFALVQSPEAGLSIGSRGVTIACDLSQANPRKILWREIQSIEKNKLQGSPAITLRLRAPNDPSRDYRRFKFWPGSRVTIQARSLRVSQADLKMLLDRYFSHYAIPQSSKEAS